jgi:hypothetical protein
MNLQLDARLDTHQNDTLLGEGRHEMRRRARKASKKMRLARRGVLPGLP